MTALDSRKRLAAPERREQILDAAAQLFIAQGFEAVSMADIAARLGVSRPAVYSYYPSTEAVLDVLLDQRLKALWSHLERLIPARAASESRLPVGLYADLFSFLLSERQSLLLLHSGGGPAFQARRSLFLAELGRRLEVQYPSVRRAPHQMSVVTHLLDSLAYYALQQEAAHPGSFDVQGLATTLDRFVRGGVARLADDT